ncbi:TonB-dependent receptor [Asticcacaulis sp. W401b]|uniref:TonB-dependent receptor n=1 Tax=Asticcacaulis sp. W401b TaxID=3388666 RepID=UPI003970CE03
MQKPPSKSPKSTLAKYLMAGSGLAMLAVSGAAYAQQAAPAAQDDIDTVIVVGARASQQSAIDRKKRAKTATDSIVADDVGAFPDRNLNEAISRVAGTALARNEFGEGDGVSIRGNSADLSRVEIDGLGVQNTGSLALGGDGRAADMRELPADLIASVDVVKGTTADMTEGSLGGGIQIKTRTALDFKKPYLSLRVGGERNSLGKKITPDINLIASRKFMDGRLGVLFNVSARHVQNNGHNMETVTSGNAGYAAAIDFDNSPEKTFTFNPSTVTGDGANVVMANSTESPLSLITKSANAKTKADCLAAFPILTTGSNNVKNQRVYEQITCLNQWNDYHPSLIRSFLNSQEEKRLSADFRVDYRVNDHLTVYGKYAIANRLVDDQFRNRNLGGVNIDVTNTWLATTGNPRIRSVNPAYPYQYYLYDPQYGIGTFGNNPFLGHTVNVDPASVKVDANHHLTEFSISDGTATIDQIDNTIDVKTNYLQFGGNYKNGPLKVDFIVGRSEGESSRTDTRTSRSTTYGLATLKVLPSGLWTYDLPATYNETDPAAFVQLSPQAASAAVAATINNPAIPAYTAAQRPLVTPNFSIQYSPRLQETEETTAKIDLTYNLKDTIPFFTGFKTGLSYRNAVASSWGFGGYEVKSASGTFGQPGYVAPVVVPTNALRGSFRACLPTSTSIEPCNYGYVPSTNLLQTRYGVDTFTPDQLLAIISDTMEKPDSVFFDGFPNRGDLFGSWQGINVQRLLGYLGQSQNFNFDCLKVCQGSDGKMYEQPKGFSDEKFTAAYYMLEFEQELPFNLSFDGNVGLRVVDTEVNSTGFMTFRSRRKTAAFDPLNPYLAAGVSDTIFRQNANLSRKTRDYLPSYNFALWVVPDQVVLRYYTAKTVARPPISRLLPAGECIFDERSEEYLAADGSTLNDCTGRVGNPELKPYTAKDSNISVEWYPNKDTMMSLAYHKLDVRIGAPEATTVSGVKVFAGSDQVDPVTGQPVSELEFDVPTWRNGDPYQRTGWEFSMKTAFTFLPWYLRYTGADFNASKLEAASNIIRDPNSGDAMPPQGQSDFYNLSVWYDDGKTNARVSYQYRTERFDCITSCGSNARNNYPGPFGIAARPVPYSPGTPRYIDESGYLDAKITHKLRPNVDLYLEARNLTRESQAISGGNYAGFADGVENLYKLSYGGRRFLFGVTYRLQ